MKNSLVFMAFLLLFGAGCQKIDVGPPVSNDPIFGLKGSLDGQNFDWQAGNAEKYMLAFFDGDSTDKPRFVADLGQLKTPTENDFPKIVIEFFGEGATSNWPVVLKNGELLFAQKDLVFTQKRILELQNTSFGNAPIASKWSVGNDSSTVFSPVFEFSDLNFSAPISLETTDAKNRTTRQTAFLDLEKKQEWRVRLFSDQGILSALTNSPDSLVSLKWGNGAGGSTTFIDSTELNYSVVANFSSGKTASAEIKLDPADIFGPFVAAADFSWKTEVKTDSIMVGGGWQPLRILVKYIDNSGREFRSDAAIQPAASRFEILAVEDFERNEAGILTKKIRVNFDCILADKSGATKKMSAVEGTIAVGVPD